MAHLLERGHGDRRDALNRAPLAEEDWQVR
jgi:hypothetical protein